VSRNAVGAVLRWRVFHTLARTTILPFRRSAVTGSRQAQMRPPAPRIPAGTVSGAGRDRDNSCARECRHNCRLCP